MQTFIALAQFILVRYFSLGFNFHFSQVKRLSHRQMFWQQNPCANLFITLAAASLRSQWMFQLFLQTFLYQFTLYNLFLMLHTHQYRRRRFPYHIILSKHSRSCLICAPILIQSVHCHTTLIVGSRGPPVPQYGRDIGWLGDSYTYNVPMTNCL